MKNKKLIFMIFTLVCFVTAGTCTIVDIAISQQITWSTYPLLSIAFGWVAVLPVFIKKHGITLFLCAFTLLSLPYLYLLSQMIPVTDWFIPIGLPSAISGIIALWLLYSLFRYTKINIWYKSAISFFLLAVIITPVINYYVDIYLGEYPFGLDRIISLFSCIVATAVIGIIGYVRSKKSTEKS